MRLQPQSTTISQIGTMRESTGTCLPITRLRAIRSSPLTPAATATGTPAAANATGELLAMRHRTAAGRASNPSATSIAAVIATGDPKPAAPSRNAPNPKAMKSACSLRSAVMEARVERITSNWPEPTASEWTHSAPTTIHRIGKTAVTVPSSAAEAVMKTGIAQARTATRNAPTRANSGGAHAGRRLHAMRPKSSRSGIAAARAETAMVPRGAVAGVHGMAED